MEKTYKFNKGFYKEKREVTIDILEDIKWTKVHSIGPHFDGQSDYFAIIPYSKDENAWFNNRYIDKHKIGDSLILSIKAVDENDLSLQSLDEFNKQVKEYLNGYYGICVDKYYKIHWLFQLIKFDNCGRPICNVVICNNIAGTHSHQLLINEEIPIENITEHRYGGIFNIYVRNSEHYKKIWYSMIFKYLEEMNLFSDDFLIVYNNQFVDKSVDIDYIANLAKQIEDLTCEKIDGKIELSYPEKNEKIISEIKNWLEIY